MKEQERQAHLDAADQHRAAGHEQAAKDHEAAAGQGTLLCDRCERGMTEDDIRVGLNDGVVCPECLYLERLTKTELLAEAAVANGEAHSLESRHIRPATSRALRAWARRLRLEAK